MEQPGIHKQAADWFRQNPHRLQLGNIGFDSHQDGTAASIQDIKNIQQELDLWTGEIHSRFRLTISQLKFYHLPFEQDEIAVSVRSELVKLGRLKIFIRFPYPLVNGLMLEITGTTMKDIQPYSVHQRWRRYSPVLDSNEYWTDLRWSGMHS
jgi:hypothetical protein